MTAMQYEWRQVKAKCPNPACQTEVVTLVECPSGAEAVWLECPNCMQINQAEPGRKINGLCQACGKPLDDHPTEVCPK